MPFYESKSGYHSLITETVRLLPIYLDSVAKAVNETAQVVQAGGVGAAESNLDELADKLACLISLFTVVCRDCKTVFGSEKNSKFNLSIKSVKIHLLSILKAVKSAKDSGDQVMLADLLEYELQDNLTQWKITAIPQIKNLIQAAKNQSKPASSFL